MEVKGFLIKNKEGYSLGNESELAFGFTNKQYRDRLSEILYYYVQCDKYNSEINQGYNYYAVNSKHFSIREIKNLFKVCEVALQNQNEILEINQIKKIDRERIKIGKLYLFLTNIGSRKKEQLKDLFKEFGQAPFAQDVKDNPDVERLPFEHGYRYVLSREFLRYEDALLEFRGKLVKRLEELRDLRRKLTTRRGSVQGDSSATTNQEPTLDSQRQLPKAPVQESTDHEPTFQGSATSSTQLPKGSAESAKKNPLAGLAMSIGQPGNYTTLGDFLSGQTNQQQPRREILDTDLTLGSLKGRFGELREDGQDPQRQGFMGALVSAANKTLREIRGSIAKWWESPQRQDERGR